MPINNAPQVIEPYLFTIPEVAAHLKVCRSTVYELLKGHELTSVKIGRCARIPADSVADLIQRLRKSLPQS